ncbi:putative succinate-semialdehyde dehydrogenase (NAD(+)) [Helianthus annuus]|uniref:Succinate-semialdehyde dehydrogenase, mitochondrial n=1 Tax=Helianthus annuus TaxID=4232 RepID=A0A9K3IVI9_HELAN|nr:putative succinate-semialdehyde dehydrogenase (NAD(+)) [Helianthus annuus]KAJ0916445.1 putative succinate-semialdehyde dehydrogenase (NAD(+)) [Helianthus annuus]
MSMGSESLVSRLKSCGLLQTKGLIGGKWVDAYDGKTIEVHNPANGQVIASVACMGDKEAKDAISAAYDAFAPWSKLTAADRSNRLRNWLDTGLVSSSSLQRRQSVFMPVGVVGVVTPWNFPLAMITRKVGPALACGCTVVIKPSEFTPLTALAAAELALQSGIPPGVLNVVTGDAPKIGNSLLESPQVRKITFTGSTAVGKKLMAGAAETVKKVSLELGGNAPCIVFDDADLEVALKGSLATKFRNSGQTCVCANRILVQEGIYEKFTSAFSNAVQDLKVGNGFSEGVVQGPLINEAAVQKVDSFVQDAISKGAKVLVGGKRHSLGFTFYEPTIIGDVKNEMLIARQEVFGPVAPVIRFKTEEEAIQIANDTNAGLAAYIFTNSMKRSWRVAEALEYGIVGVNEGLVSTEVAPFGGYKQSGLGREGSKYGLDEYLEIKYVCMGNMG